MKTLKEALSPQDKNSLIDKLNKAIDIIKMDPDSIDDASWKSLNRKLDIFDEEMGLEAKARNRIKEALWNKGVTNLKAVYDTIENTSSYNNFEKLLNIISSKELYDAIDTYPITNLIEDKMGKEYNEDLVYGLYMISPSTTDKAVGKGEILLKCILSDCVSNNSTISDVYCKEYTFEVKNLLYAGSKHETELFGSISFGYGNYGLDNTINKNIEKGIMDPKEKPFYDDIYKKAFLPYYYKHNKGNFAGILLIIRDEMDMDIMNLNNIQNGTDIFNFLSKNEIYFSRKNRLSFYIK